MRRIIRERRITRSIFCLILLFTGCVDQSPWRHDAIAAGDPRFDSARLTYSPLNGYPPWKIEFLKTADRIEVFLYLIQHRFHPLPNDPFKIKVSLIVEEPKIYSAPSGFMNFEDPQSNLSMQYGSDHQNLDRSEERQNLTMRRIEEIVPLFEGKMKIRFSDSLAAELIQSLQEGKKVSILIDGLEETIEPDLFKEKFSKLYDSSRNWLNIRNPLQ